MTLGLCLRSIRLSSGSLPSTCQFRWDMRSFSQDTSNIIEQLKLPGATVRIIPPDRTHQPLEGINSKDMDVEGMKITKRIARSGVCSRRAAKQLLEEGVVTVDEEKVTTNLIIPHDAVLKVRGKVCEIPSSKLWMYFKPRGEIVTNRDSQGRRTIFQSLSELYPLLPPRLVAVGRLDLHSEGLMLLTNDSAIATYMEHPSNGFKRVYHVHVRGQVDESKFEELSLGVQIDGIEYRPMEVRFRRMDLFGSTRRWLIFSLMEGKNRTIRLVCERILRVSVQRIVRVQYGPIKMKKMRQGDLRDVGVPPDLKHAAMEFDDQLKINKPI